MVREGRQPEFLNIEENWALLFFLELVDTSGLSNDHPKIYAGNIRPMFTASVT